MATYPKRLDECRQAVSALAHQVDEVRLVANEYEDASPFAHLPKNVEVIIPERNWRDVGKFITDVADDDIVFLTDDDIDYPEDYCEVLSESLDRYRSIDAVVGFHGTTYSDFFDGKPAARLVYSFRLALAEDRYVNQLGTGTVSCFGRQLPALAVMEGSERFVDVRFANYCATNGSPRIAIAREAGWLCPMDTDETIFDQFTIDSPIEVLREIRAIAGFRRLEGLYPQIEV